MSAKHPSRKAQFPLEADGLVRWHRWLARHLLTSSMAAHVSMSAALAVLVSLLWLLLRLLVLRLFEFRPWLLLELLVAVAVTVVVAAVIAIVTSRGTLTFFTSPLGPAISFVVTEIVAIEALNVVFIALLLVVRGKGFIRAVLA